MLPPVSDGIHLPELYCATSQSTPSPRAPMSGADAALPSHHPHAKPEAALERAGSSLVIFLAISIFFPLYHIQLMLGSTGEWGLMVLYCSKSDQVAPSQPFASSRRPTARRWSAFSLRILVSVALRRKRKQCYHDWHRPPSLHTITKRARLLRRRRPSHRLPRNDLPLLSN